jgi:hypothetical protein
VQVTLTLQEPADNRSVNVACNAFVLFAVELGRLIVGGVHAGAGAVGPVYVRLATDQL